jgi:hypothetical protein
MKLYWTTTEREERTLMDLVCNELVKRRLPIDNYNVQELAFRQAVSDGAMRHDEYYNKL